MGDTATVAILDRRRSLTEQGLDLLLAPGSAQRYFARSRDPDGVLHGVVGNAKHGYFEVSPNIDAVAFRIVDDATAHGIMKRIENLSAEVRPNTFLLPNTDAGGGVGYDDMLCGDGKTCGGIFEYGTWVNGGVWTTVEARALLAYFRTARYEDALRSAQQMYNLYVSTWRMDAPLKDFGLSVWADLDINLTIDAFGTAAGLVRGLFAYLYTATSLTLIPRVPDNITAMQQKFGIRWGPYSIRISTTGIASTGIVNVSLNGQPLTSAHSFNSTTIVLDYDGMPTPSPAAVASMQSNIATASDSVTVEIIFGGQQHQRKPVRSRFNSQEPTMPADAVLWFRADDLNSTYSDGSNVTLWKNAAMGSAAAVFPCPHNTVFATPGLSPPVFQAGGGVVFDGQTSFLCNDQPVVLAPEKTVVAVIEDKGSRAAFSSVFVDDTDRGLAVSPSGCAEGIPVVPGVPCSDTAARVLSIDWSGSDDGGSRNISHLRTIVTVSYNAKDIATSTVNGCNVQQPGAIVTPVSAGLSTAFLLGSRGDPASYGRYFKGVVHEIIVFNRTLTSQEYLDTVSSLQAKWSIPPATSCEPPPPQFNCTQLRLVDFAAKGLSATILNKVRAFVAAASANQTLSNTLPVAMAKAALDYNTGFEARCAGIVAGNISALRSTAATEASLVAMLQASTQMFLGLNNTVTQYRTNSLPGLPHDIAALWKF
eukprot:m.322710 g.322710  ORF g.322710 m.322710 type:complete len:705 (+) comp20357_c0_seq8:1156-3270(+)